MMKKLFALFATLLLLTGCSNDDIIQQVDPDSPEVTFVASMDFNEDDSTRATIEPVDSFSCRILWEEKDSISLFSNKDITTNSKLSLTEGVGQKNATFRGPCTKGSSYYAIYPYREEHAFVSSRSNVYIHWDGAHQTAREGSFDKGTPMVCAVSSTEKVVPLKFKNICSFLRLTIDYRCQSIVLRANPYPETTTYPLVANKVMVNISGGIPVVSELSEPCDSITITSGTSEPLQPGTYYVAVLPGTLKNGFSLKFTSVGGDNIFTKTTTKSVALKRSNILDLGKISIKEKMMKLKGNGTYSDPYKIGSYEDLCRMSDHYSMGNLYCYYKFFKQTNDIDCQGKTLTPIGCVNSSILQAFHGTYDGGNHIIKNLVLGETDSTKVTHENLGFDKCYISALFAFVKNANIQNLRLKDVYPVSTAAGNSHANDEEKATAIKSHLVGVALGAVLHDGDTDSLNVIVNVCVTMSGDSHYSYSVNEGVAKRVVYGGIVGLSLSHMDIGSCRISGSIQENFRSDLYAGGIVGYISCGQCFISEMFFDAKVLVYSCYSALDLDFKTWACYNLYLGGILGYADNGRSNKVSARVEACVNDGTLSVSHYNYPIERVAGLVGSLNGSSEIYNCINNGYIFGQKYAGGIAAQSSPGAHISDCVNTGPIKAGYYDENNTFHSQYPSSIVALCDSSILFACYNINSSCDDLINADASLNLIGVVKYSQNYYEDDAIYQMLVISDNHNLFPQRITLDNRPGLYHNYNTSLYSFD